MVIKAELIDHMGDDLTIVNAARVSMDKESYFACCDEGCCTGECFTGDYNNPQLLAKDEKLIKYLAKNGHWTPFSHAMITLRETVPIFVARQRFKHKVGFTENEISRRYVDSEPAFFKPDVWRRRAENVKQGSSKEPVHEPLRINIASSMTTCETYEKHIERCVDYYNELLENGTCPEQARMVLPQSMLTSYYVTGSLYAFIHAYKLRVDSHAQEEIQMLARQWDQLIRPLYPISWGALIDEVSTY